jgi:hypothetical protein
MILEWNIEWQRLYVEALLETNPLILVGRVKAAEVAILSRIEELCTCSDEQEEWQAMEDAITGLAALKREISLSQLSTVQERAEIARARLLAS